MAFLRPYFTNWSVRRNYRGVHYGAPVRPRPPGFNRRLGPKYSTALEHKWRDSTIAASTPNRNETAPVISFVGGIGQGNGDEDRIGNQITIHSIAFKIAGRPQAGTDAPVSYRIFLVYDRQTNGAAPIITDLLTSTTTPFSFNNMDNRFRFKTLWTSGLFQLEHEASASGQELYWTEVFMNCHLPVQYGTTGANVGDIQTGSLHMVWISNAATAAANAHTFQLGLRVRFTDGRAAGGKVSVGKKNVKGSHC